jgi:hypothetical protein
MQVPKSPTKPKPGTPLNSKALAAYHSELKRYEKSLVDYQRFLESKEREIVAWERANQVFDDEGEDYGPEECDCTQEDAIAGCDCEACEGWRFTHKQTIAHSLMEADAAIAKDGDEINFLERLFELKDKRK